MKKVLFVLLLLSISSFSQEIALVKYSGGGDWYVIITNLIKYCNANINTKINTATVEPGALIYFFPYDRTWKCRFSDAEISFKINMVAGGFFTSMTIMEWTNTSKEIKNFPIMHL
jgi:hypothetical protein